MHTTIYTHTDIYIYRYKYRFIKKSYIEQYHTISICSYMIFSTDRISTSFKKKSKPSAWAPPTLRGRRRLCGLRQGPTAQRLGAQRRGGHATGHLRWEKVGTTAGKCRKHMETLWYKKTIKIKHTSVDV